MTRGRPRLDAADDELLRDLVALGVDADVVAELGLGLRVARALRPFECRDVAADAAIYGARCSGVREVAAGLAAGRAIERLRKVDAVARAPLSIAALERLAEYGARTDDRAARLNVPGYFTAFPARTLEGRRREVSQRPRTAAGSAA